MKLTIGSKSNILEVIPLYYDKKKNILFDKKNSEDIIRKLKEENFEAQDKNINYVNIDKKKYLVIGIKKDFSNEDLRKAYYVVLCELKKRKIKEAKVNFPNNKEETFYSCVEGLELGDYKFDKYVSKKEKENLTLYLNSDKKYSKILKEILTISKNVKFCRNIVNENSYVMTPKKLESLSREFAKKNKLNIKVLDEKAIVKEKLNLLYAVGCGSINPPRLIIVEYNGDPKSKDKIALVGKGITFDTGGVNLKPTGYIEEMRMDMGGAACMLSSFMSAVEMKIKKNIVLVIAAAENVVSSKSFKSGDIYVSYNGTSVEIMNTDAEGRLVLGDAISYVQKKYKPNKIIDAATLTGACLVALGPSLIAMLGNDEKMKKDIFESGENTFERVWELPIYDEHRDLIKGEISDIKNLGGRDGGTITAAAFLEKFVEDKVKWVHLDIAGAMMSKKPEFYVPKGGTGRGVRLIYDYLKR